MTDREYIEWLNRRADCPCIGGCPDCERDGDGEE